MTGVPEIIELHEFEKQFFQCLNNLRQEDLFCDVRFDINGKIFACHKLLLVSISRYFRTMFNGNFKESNSDVVTLNEIDTSAFEDILNAVYTSTIRLCPSNVYSILRASHLMQLEMIQTTCVSYILQNPEISYLVDTCLFAHNIEQMELHAVCVQTIAEDILNYGKTDSFLKIPVDVFESILSQCDIKDYEEEAIFLLILKWSKHNEANRNNMQTLLETARLKTIKYISSPIIVELMNSCCNMFVGDGKTEIQKFDPDSLLEFNLYLHTVDVKTGQKGSIALKMSDNFDKYVVSSFHPITSNWEYVCRVGSTIYCFELMAGRHVFSCYDKNNKRSILESPDDMNDCYEMATMGNLIYFLGKRFDDFYVWIYNHALKTWQNKRSKTAEDDGDDVEEEDLGLEFDEDLCNYYYSFAGTFCNGVFYVIAKKSETASKKGNRPKCESANDKFIIAINCLSWTVTVVAKVPLYMEVNPSMCVCDNKIALSGTQVDGSLRRTFIMYDMTTYKWLTELKPMKMSPRNHILIHYNGFLYAIENGRPSVANEKYDLKSNMWISIPSLPKRITFEYGTSKNIVATGYLFGMEVNTVQ